MNSKLSNRKNLTGPYALLQSSYWMGFVVYGAFSSFYLLDAGLSNTAIGILLAVGALVAALLSPLVGSFLDKSKRVSNREVIAVFSLGIVLLSVILHFVPVKAAFMGAGVFTAAYFFTQLASPFINGVGAEYMNSGYGLNFGVGRAGGSLGYAAFALIMGVITANYGPGSIPWVSMIAYLALACVAILLLPAVKGRKISVQDSGTVHTAVSASDEAADHAQEELPDSMGPMAFMKKYPTYMAFLVGLVMIYFAHNLVNTYALQILQSKGGNSQDVGMAAAIAACAEMLPMLTYHQLRKRFSMPFLLRFSAVFFILKEVGSLLAPTPGVYMAVQLLQALAWGVLAVTIVYYVNDIIDSANTSQGQAYAGMALTLGNVLASLICGSLIDICGVNMTLGLASAVCGLGAMVVFVTTKRA